MTDEPIARRVLVAARSPRVLIDAAIATVALAGTLTLLANVGAGHSGGATRQLDLLGGLLAAGATLPLLRWRRMPLGVFVICTAASAGLMGADYAAGPPLGPTAALYLLAASRDAANPWTRWTSLIVGALLAIHLTAFGLSRDVFPLTVLVEAILLWGIAWFAGERTRLRHEQLAELKQRALRNERDAQRDRRLAAAEERARIARDLHDSAGHAINVIGVQAGAARLLQERDPARSRAALQTIEDLARETVGEIDRIVHTLRTTEHGDEQDAAPPGLSTLDALIAQHRESGMPVYLTIDGQPRTLDATIDQAAYRILQEALTNAARHGSGATHVELRFKREALQLTVVNPMHPAANGPLHRGHGLIGMRERAIILGGEFTATHQDDTYSISVELPYSKQRT